MAKRARTRPDITLYLNRLVGLGYARQLIGGFNISVSDAEVVGLASLTATKTVEGEFCCCPDFRNRIWEFSYRPGEVPSMA